MNANYGKLPFVPCLENDLVCRQNGRFETDRRIASHARGRWFETSRAHGKDLQIDDFGPKRWLPVHASALVQRCPIIEPVYGDYGIGNSGASVARVARGP